MKVFRGDRIVDVTGEEVLKLIERKGWAQLADQNQLTKLEAFSSRKVDISTVARIIWILSIDVKYIDIFNEFVNFDIPTTQIEDFSL